MKHLLAVLALILLTTGLAATNPLIRLQHSTFDPAKTGLNTLTAEPASERAPDGNGYYLLQFKGPILEEWKTGAADAGAELLDYIPEFAFVVRADKNAEAKLRALPYVRWMGDYKPSWRISPKLGNKDADVVVRMFEGSDSASVASRIASLGGTHDFSGAGLSIRAHLPATALSSVARAAGVAWIEPKPHYKLSNNVARGIINAGAAWTNLGLFGAGQIISIADTGLDTGSITTLSADFQGRVIAEYSLGRIGDWSDSTSNGAHGTHVAGSVLGSGALSGSNAAAHSYAGSFAGVAPEASLVFQSIMDSLGELGGLPSNLSNLFTTPYSTNGARIASNSWGDNTTSVLGTYTNDSYNTDNFVWSHKDMVICFAAGNAGTDTNPADGLVDPGSIEPPSTAKNCISVGASESLVTSGGFQGTYGSQTWGLATAPISGDTASNNASGMAGFSSRGPTADGRIKPDICAPGTNIISCRSHAPGAGVLWGAYGNDYAWSGGTSMACPIVAGACALAREYYIKQKGIAAPSAALIKATLLNGAFDMTPGQYTSPQEIGTRPNSVEGWGRLDLKNSLQPAASRFVFPTDATAGLHTGNINTYSYRVSPSNEPLKVTLVWTDYRGSQQVTAQLVNDLDLSITGPNGATYYGNDSGSHTPDRTNNIEEIDIPSPAAGLYTITVQAYNVPHGPQPYALIVAGPVTTTQATSLSTVSAAKALADGALIQITSKNVSAGSDQLKDCFYIEETDRSSGIKVQYGAGGGPTIPEGSLVTVTGTLATVNGERVINNPILSY